MLEFAPPPADNPPREGAIRRMAEGQVDDFATGDARAGLSAGRAAGPSPERGVHHVVYRLAHHRGRRFLHLPHGFAAASGSATRPRHGARHGLRLRAPRARTVPHGDSGGARRGDRLLRKRVVAGPSRGNQFREPARPDHEDVDQDAGAEGGDGRPIPRRPDGGSRGERAVPPEPGKGVAGVQDGGAGVRDDHPGAAVPLGHTRRDGGVRREGPLHFRTGAPLAAHPPRHREADRAPRRNRGIGAAPARRPSLH